MTEKTAQDWEKISDFSRQHFEEMKQIIIANDISVLDSLPRVNVELKENASRKAGIYFLSKSLHQLFG